MRKGIMAMEGLEELLLTPLKQMQPILWTPLKATCWK